LDQYIPEAGAGETSGAVVGSGTGGNLVCGPRLGRDAFEIGLGVGIRAGDVVLLMGLLAMADVERNTNGRRSSFTFAGTVADEGLDCSDFSGVFVIPKPLGCTGTFGTLGDDLEADCDRCRESFDGTSLRLSMLFEARCPGV
jgi:hypothetical protein